MSNGEAIPSVPVHRGVDARSYAVGVHEKVDVLFLVAIAIALAEPVFEGPPEIVGLAERAWRAGERCTSWTPPHPDVVPVVWRSLPGEAGGRALLGTHTLEIGGFGVDHRSVVPHEVAHLWFRDGPAGLREGLTELLAACMAEEDTSLRSDLARVPEEPMPMDLQSWTTSALLTAADGVMYDAARAYVRTVARVVPREELFGLAAGGWEALEARLARAEGAPIELRTFLEVDAGRQGVLLSDDDRDGLTMLEELLIGTSPDARDSDFDGAPDGEPDGIVLPVAWDGDSYCSPWIGASEGATLQLLTRGGSDRTALEIATTGRTLRLGPPIDVVGAPRADFSITLALGHGDHRPRWLAFVGSWVPSPTCAVAGGIHLRVAPEDRPALERLLPEVARQAPTVRRLIGDAMPHRVDFSEPDPGRSRGFVAATWLSRPGDDKARAYVAGLVVARALLADRCTTTEQEAVASRLAGFLPAEPYVSLDREAVVAVLERTATDGTRLGTCDSVLRTLADGAQAWR